MKIKTTLLLACMIFLTTIGKSQTNAANSPYSFSHELNTTIPLIVMPAHDFTPDLANSIAEEKAGNMIIHAKLFNVDVTTQNSGVWTNLDNGDRVWRLQIKSNEALSTYLYYDNFYIPEGALLSVYSPDRSQVYTFSFEDNQGNYLFSTPEIIGAEQIVEYFEPAYSKGKGAIHITDLAHQFRSLAADPCEVNVICTPEGTGWQDKKKGVCRIAIPVPGGVGYCTGTLINNTAQNCKRYILTAYHCGGNLSNYNQWVFRFNFEATQCTGQADTYGTTTNQFTGCVKRAEGNETGGSDMLLLEMTATTNPSWWASTAYFNGWSKATTAPANGICIHHPNGDNKKISAVNGTATSSTWPNGGASGAHWRVTWKATTNGHGVTEGGSSGSALFNSSYQVVGTLTGGSSFCTATSNPDFYGKLSYHWSSNGTSAATQLKPWLDPTNSGVTSLNGSFSPCSIGINEQQQEIDFVIYPNPNNGTFNIEFELQNHNDVQIRVFNVVGQQVYKKAITNTVGGMYSIDLYANSGGIYFVELQTAEKIYVKKVNITR